MKTYPVPNFKGFADFQDTEIGREGADMPVFYGGDTDPVVRSGGQIFWDAPTEMPVIRSAVRNGLDPLAPLI